MRRQVGSKTIGRSLLAASLAVITAGAVTLVAEPTSARAVGGQPSGPAIAAPAETAAGHHAGPAMAAPSVPAPSDVVREVGSWFAHGYTLDLRRDGTGTFSVWLGAFDGHRVQLRLIPAPGPATVAEVIAVETVGDGALGPDARPGIGGLVTILFGEKITTAHVEWSSGPDRHAVDLCPAVGLDEDTMNALRCGA